MALIYPCLHGGVQEINRHSWQIIRWLAEMIAAVPHQRELPGLGTVSGTPRGLQGRGGVAREALGQAGSPNLERRPLGVFFGERWDRGREQRSPPLCAQESRIQAIFSKEQALPQILGCIIDFSS